MLGKDWTVLSRAASLYTDPFIMMSGTLTAYSVFGRLHRNEKVNLLNEYLSRLFRYVNEKGEKIILIVHV